MTLLHPLLRALAFLSRLPAPASAYRLGPHPLGPDAAWFAPAGLLMALLPAALLAALLALGLGALAASAGATLALVALTGALHEDGLGDTADGLFGHRSAEDALRIMKDSRVGTYGALALAGALLLRVVLLAEIAADAPLAGALAMLAAAAGSRGLMAWTWARLPNADPGGLADRMERPSRRTGRRALLVGAALFVAPALTVAGAFGTALAAFLALAATLRLHAVLRRRLGGANGDALGANQQIAEIALLLGLALAI